MMIFPMWIGRYFFSGGTLRGPSPHARGIWAWPLLFCLLRLYAGREAAGAGVI